MLSFTNFSSRFLVLPNSRSHSLPSILFVTNSRIRKRRIIIQKQFLALSFVAAKESCGSLLAFHRGFCGGGCSGFVRRCVKWDSEEGDLALEAEILEFMKYSKKPDAFPSKKELVEAGRMDLVDAIANRGGWLSLGWDLSDEDEEEQENVGVRVSDSIGNEVQSSGLVSWSSGNSFQSASSSGRSL
jgi:hypothetical protein